MLDKVIFGRYVNGNSLIHQLDPRTKLILSFCFIIIVFLANNLWSNLVIIALVVLTIVLSKLPIKFLIDGLKPILFVVAFTSLLHLFFTKGGHTYIAWHSITIEHNGVMQAIIIAIRLILLVLMTSVLTLTTSPISITDGTESLLSPLKKIKFPVHELALMLSISLRFIPTLIDETDKIMKAQMSRGSDITVGSLNQRIKAIVPMLVPLFVSAFNRAEDLALAMEVRGYKGDEGRTKYRRLQYRSLDIMAAIIFVVFTISLLLVRG